MKTSLRFILKERWFLFPFFIVALIGFLGISIDAEKQSKDSTFPVYPDKGKDDFMLHPYLLRKDGSALASCKFFKNAIYTLCSGYKLPPYQNYTFIS